MDVYNPIWMYIIRIIILILESLLASLSSLKINKERSSNCGRLQRYCRRISASQNVRYTLLIFSKLNLFKQFSRLVFHSALLIYPA